MTALPLDSYPAFRAPTLDALTIAVKAALGARFVELPKNGAPDNALANHYRLPNSGLWFCTYGMPVALQFPQADHVRVQFHYAGTGATWVGNRLVAVTPRQACISSGPVEINFAADFQQLVWRVPKHVLVQKLATLIGGPVIWGLDFEPILDLSAPAAATMLQILRCLLEAADNGAGETNRAITGELEQAMITAFLGASPHPFRDRLGSRAPGAAPWQVRRAESYIAEHWDQPLSIEALAAVTGASARSIFRAFQQSRGYTPLEFARRIRLEHANRMLQDREAMRSVTEVAFACGFADLGRFSRDFAKAFGERPSSVRQRMKGAARPET